jgi:hypothetical protein
MDRSPSPFDPFDKMQFSDTQCFLCGKFLIDGSTREHIFPRWLLHRFDLFDQRLNLINGTSIPYRHLTIPCCDECNSIYLSPIESIMQGALYEGPDRVQKVSPMTLYIWMGKIYYGLLFKDLSLLADRQDPAAGRLMNKETMENYRALHAFLQSSRMEIKFEGFFPGSIFVFELSLDEDFPPFDYSDNPIGMTICIRMGNVGIITCLKDDGMIYSGLEQFYQKIREKRLNPIQFDELCAVVFYRAYSMIRSGKYVGLTSEIQTPTIVRIPGYSLKPYFDDWNYPILAQFLAEFWGKYGIKYEEIYNPPYLMTFLQEFTE